MTTTSQSERRRPRPTPAARGYDRQWRKIRAGYLAQHPRCEQCEKAGRLRAAVDVDHVVPMSEGGSRSEWANLQALCKPCHRAKSAKDAARRRRGDAPRTRGEGSR